MCIGVNYASSWTDRVDPKSVEVAFSGRDEHAGLNIAQVGANLVPVLGRYRGPSLLAVWRI